MTLPAVIDNTGASQLELSMEGHTAILSYRRDGGRLVLVHTEVPEALAGRGIGGALVRAAVDLAAASKLPVEPRCPFANAWLRDHPAEAQRVTVHWPDQ